VRQSDASNSGAAACNASADDPRGLSDRVRAGLACARDNNFFIDRVRDVNFDEEIRE
jgi:hypothetical protein